VSDFSHIDPQGRVRMVDVGDKPATDRRAAAQAVVVMRPDTLTRIQDQTVQKGNVLETARIAGVMAAKRTAALIPMCHPLHLEHVQVDFFPDPRRDRIRIEAAVRIFDRTGAEMEALTAATVSALTIYDMCKSYDKEMQITDIWLISKSGGKSGSYHRPTPNGQAG